MNPPMGGASGYAPSGGPPPPYYPQAYPPQYYNMPPGGGHPRYPPDYPPHPGMIAPPGRGMYPPGQAGMYQPPPNVPMGMYGQPPSSNYLNQYEEQLYHEALGLLNQMKTSGSDRDNVEKKSRLNFILSTYPKVHQKLKESLPQKP